MATAAEHSESQEMATTDIAVNCQAEFQKYVYNKAEDVWALVTLKAPCHEDENKRAPIDVVAVIDKSGSMAGAKLKLVKKTLEFFITQLKEGDRLAVVTYDTNVYLDFGLITMNKENKAKCSQNVQSIRDGSSTNLSGGLLKGLCQIIDRDANKNEVASVLYFTDGLANAGITSSAGIVAAMNDPKKFDGAASRVQSPPVQQPRHQSWLQKITGKSPIQHTDAAADKKETKGGPASASVYTFGFGDDHDPDMLKAISDAGNGMYYYIENEDKIAESFGHCLGGLLSTVGQGINMDITMYEGVLIKEVHVKRPFEIAADKKSLNVNMGDLQSEEERDVVLKLSVEALPIPREETPQPLFSAVANYFNVISASLATATGDLGILRTTAADNKPEDSSADVNKQKCRIETSAAIAAATELADLGQYNEAECHLQQAFASNQANVYADDAYFADLRNDLTSCSNVVKDRDVWRKKGKKVHANIMQMHQQQRSSEPATTSAPRYKSNSKESMAAKFKGAMQ